MKISNEQMMVLQQMATMGLETAIDEGDKALERHHINELAAFEELQQHRKKLIWHPVCDGIENELDVFLINLNGTDDLSTVHVTLRVGDQFKIDGVYCPREDVYFGQWELEDIVEEYPNATWRDIVTEDTE